MTHLIIRYWHDRKTRLIIFIITRTIHIMVTLPLLIAWLLLCYAYIKNALYSGVYGDKYQEIFMFPVSLFILLPISLSSSVFCSYWFTKSIFHKQKNKVKYFKWLSIILLIISVSIIALFVFVRQDNLFINIKSNAFIDPLILYFMLFVYFCLLVYLIIFHMLIYLSRVLNPFKSATNNTTTSSFKRKAFLDKCYSIYILGYFALLFFFVIYIYVTGFRVHLLLNVIVIFVISIVTIGLFDDLND